MAQSFQSPALQALFDRGFLYQATDLEALDAALVETPHMPFYIGYDATAPSLHVGSLLTIMATRILQTHGLKPIILMGGGTTKVGDPTGKDKSRQMLSDAQINTNIDTLKGVFKKFLTFGEGPTDAVMVNNDTWLSTIKYIDFLREYGPHFTINRMLTFESVKQRLDRETPMTFLEFNYMLLQAYDFHALHHSHGCRLQIGGSDQWGNILNGVELVRRVDQAPVFGLTIPLITTASGGKMGKTAEGAIWLNDDLCDAYTYWQFWRNTDDADTLRFLKYFTDLPMDALQPYEAVTGAHLNEAKKILADASTTMVHGAEALPDVHAAVHRLFGGQDATLESTGTDDNGNAILKSAAPLFSLAMAPLTEGTLTVIDLLMEAKLATSRGEAKRLIQGGGCRVNDTKILEEAWSPSPHDLQTHNVLKIQSGKKKIAYIQFTL